MGGGAARVLEVVALDVVTGVERGAVKVLGVAALKVVKGVGSGAARVLGVAALGLETRYRCRGSRVHGSQVIVPRTRAYTFALALALDGGLHFGFRLVRLLVPGILR